ncbi:MAG: hypothetical protein M9894_22600 [Planctomycetes bacterium]|nr:hypothetical protein [Planctomycetota bacterium]
MGGSKAARGVLAAAVWCLVAAVPAAAQEAAPRGPAAGDEARVALAWRYTMKSLAGRGQPELVTGVELGLRVTLRERVTAADDGGASVVATVEAVAAEARSLEPEASFIAARWDSADPAAGDRVFAAGLGGLLGKEVRYRRSPTGGARGLTGGAALQAALEDALQAHAQGRLSGWGGHFLHDLAPRLGDEPLRDALDLVGDVLPGEEDAGPAGWTRARRVHVPDLATFTFDVVHRPGGEGGMRLERGGAQELAYAGADVDPAVAARDPEFGPLFAAMRDQRLVESDVAGAATWDAGGLRRSEVTVRFASAGAAPGLLGKLGHRQRLEFFVALRLERLPPG